MFRRMIPLILILMLLLPLACAKQPEPEAEKPAVTAPAETEITLRLPLGARNDVAKAIPAYTAGFTAADGEPLLFAVSSADPAVAEGILRDDGTLYVIAHGTGETKLTVAAKTPSGEQASAAVSVTVRDARRMLALILLGVLAVALLILFGRPAAKKPEPEPEPPAEEEKIPVVIFEEPEQESETSHDP